MLYSSADYEKQLSIYREFLAISLTSNVEEMIAFSRACRERFLTVIERIMDEAIAKGEIEPMAKVMTATLHTYSIGLVVDTKTHGLEPQVQIDAFVDAFFTLILKKDTK